METLTALLSLGVEASLTGKDPTNEAEFNERIEVHKGTAPSWSEVYALMNSVTNDEVNAERDVRLNGGFVFNGKTFASDAKSRDLIQKAHGRASSAIFAETGEENNLRWDDPDEDFSWPDVDGNLMTMDAATCVEFGEAASLHELKMIKRASALKKMSPIPGDYTDDKHW